MQLFVVLSIKKMKTPFFLIKSPLLSRSKSLLSLCLFALLSFPLSSLANNSNKMIDKEQLDYSLSDEERKLAIQEREFTERQKNKIPAALLIEMTEQAEAGKIREQMNLALYYAEVKGGDDLLKSLYWYQKAAAQGDINAKGMLGLFYLNGMANIQDIDLALKYFTEAAEAGDLDSQLILAAIYSSNYQDVKQDYPKAYHYYQLASKQGSVEALLMLGTFHHRAWLGEKSPSKAKAYWLLAAELESIDAIRLLGDYYQFAWGGKKELEKAKFWYRKAVEKNDSIAAFQLANILKESAVFDIFDAEERFYCLEVAVLEVKPQILYELSEAYILGLGCEVNTEMGINYLSDSSDMGNMYASFVLSLYHFLGKDEIKALKGQNAEELFDEKYPIFRYFPLWITSIKSL